MFNRPEWTTARALKSFRSLAMAHPDDFPRRYGWGGPGEDREGDPEAAVFSLAEIDALYAEVISKIPAGATKVLEIGCGDGRFYTALKAARPALGYRGIDIVECNIDHAQMASGTVAVASVQAGDTTTISGVVLTAAGDQTASGLDFDETAGDDVAVASSLVAAINDSGNGLNGVVTANNNQGRSAVVTVRADTLGTAGDSTTLVSSDARLTVSGATLTGGVDAGVFEIGNAAEYLAEATVDWDFVVSIACLFWCTDNRPGVSDHLFDLLDAKSPKGFMVVASPGMDTLLATKMPGALTASTNVAESYYTGARAFLTDATLKSAVVPFYIHRDSTPAVVGADPTHRLKFVGKGTWDKVVGQQDARFALRKGDALPTEIQGSVRTGGLITGRQTLPVDEKWGLSRIKTKKRRA